MKRATLWYWIARILLALLYRSQYPPPQGHQARHRIHRKFTRERTTVVSVPHTGSCARLLGPLTRPGTQATAYALRCSRYEKPRAPTARTVSRLLSPPLSPHHPPLPPLSLLLPSPLSLLGARLMARSGVEFFALLSLWVDLITATPTEKAARLLLTKVA